MAVSFQSINDNQVGGVTVSDPSATNESYLQADQLKANQLFINNSDSGLSYKWVISNYPLSTSLRGGIKLSSVDKTTGEPVRVGYNVINIPEETVIYVKNDTRSYFTFVQGARPSVDTGLDGTPTNCVALIEDINQALNNLINMLVELGVLNSDQAQLAIANMIPEHAEVNKP